MNRIMKLWTASGFCVALFGLTGQASASPIEITDAGIVSQGSSTAGFGGGSNPLVDLAGDPFTLIYNFDTSLAQQTSTGSYTNTGSSSALSCSPICHPSVGTAQLTITGAGLGGFPHGKITVAPNQEAQSSANDSAVIGSTSQSVSFQLVDVFGSITTQLSNPAIPGDITAFFELSGSNIGTGAFQFADVVCKSGLIFCGSGSLDIHSVVANPTPLPAGLPLFASGLSLFGGLGFLFRRMAARQQRLTIPTTAL
jgi:hypothetical protein